MSDYQPKISKNAYGRFYAMVVRIDDDGEQNVCIGYKARHFATEKAAIKSTSAYIERLD